MNPYDQETHYVCAKHLRELGAKAECCACPPKKYGCSFEGTAEDLKPSEEKKDWEDFDERFVSKDVTGSECWSLSGRAVWQVKDFIQSQVASAVEARTQEIIELSDKIESENSTEFNEWRAFKGFRNTLRDKYLNK